MKDNQASGKYMHTNTPTESLTYLPQRQLLRGKKKKAGSIGDEVEGMSYSLLPLERQR